MDLAALFGPEGALARARAGWEPRPPQEAMAGAVWQSLERGGDLVVEAGTGVGKSLAYLLPAALWAAKNDRRVIVSTHTRALQEQLLNHELPTAARAMEKLGLPLRYAMLMGADNYLCVQRLARLRARPDSVSDNGKETLERLDVWTRDAQSGHRSALPELIPQNLWDRLARDTDLCMGPGGPYWDRCLWRRDRERADRAHILVVNHALLLSGARLPPSDAMILDEAHNLEDAASARYGVSAGLSRAVALTEEVRTAAKLYASDSLAALADEAASDIGRFLEGLARDNGLKEPDEENQGKLLEHTPTAPPAALIALDKALAEAAAAAEGRPDETEMRMLHARVSQYGHDLMAILKPDSSATARWVAWPRTGPELRAAPLDVGRRLAEGLFSRGIPSILTSATLSTGDGLKDFKARVGLPEARELILDSPYDYSTQAAFWAVEGIPDPKDEEAHVAAVTDACADIVARVPGGVFLLFSSWKLLKRVHGLLRKKITNRPVWAQGAAGHEALVREFEAAGDAVLLGVDTFWQGIDVPGEALSCVVLVKLPFPNVASALEEARRRWLDENGREYFKDWSLPRAVMKFRQGFGRLIRTSTDRGAVICLDSRVLKKGYGKSFLRSLPPCRKIDSLDGLAKFFKPAAVLTALLLALPALAANLADSEEGDRLAAVRALEEQKSATNYLSLTYAMDRDLSDKVRLAAALAVLKYEGTPPLVKLGDFLRAEAGPQVRAAVCLAFATTTIHPDNAEATALLSARLSEDPSPEVRLAAIAALEARSDRRAIRDLGAAAAKDEDAKVRARAKKAHALLSIPPPPPPAPVVKPIKPAPYSTQKGRDRCGDGNGWCECSLSDIKLKPRCMPREDCQHKFENSYRSNGYTCTWDSQQLN